jgi:hypothetical protein
MTIKLRPLITEAKVPVISLQQAVDAELFGPVYHGAREEKLSKIEDEGFKVFVGMQGKGDVSHGYDFEDYHGGIPAPIHHLGFGVYFTTVKSIAVKFSYGKTKGIKPYFLKVPRLETINHGSPRTMMEWWRENGYDFKPTYDTQDDKYKSYFFGREELLNVNHERLRATINMTNVLKSKWDAVYYKGKGIYRLLDDNQICVYEPEGKIFGIDLTLSKGLDVGAKVKARKDLVHKNQNGEVTETSIPAGTTGIIKSKREPDPEMKAAWKEKYPWYWAASVDKYILTVKWKRGVEQQCADTDVQPLGQ